VKPTKPKSRLYQLTINSRQANIINRALDMWSRMHAGQLAIALEPVSLARVHHPDVRELIKNLQDRMFPELDGGSDHNRPGCQEAFNLGKVLQHAVAWTERPPTRDRVPENNTYNGPIDSWWEDRTQAAKMLVFEGTEAVRVRDDVNRFCTLIERFTDVIGTSDVEDGIRIISEWKLKASAWDTERVFQERDRR
jgi:hypothetical protein